MSGTVSRAYITGSQTDKNYLGGKLCSSVPKEQHLPNDDIKIGTQVLLRDSKSEIVSVSAPQDGLIKPNWNRKNEFFYRGAIYMYYLLEF